jgi:hypothetical protein
VKLKQGDTVRREMPLSVIKDQMRDLFGDHIPEGVLYIPMYENGDIRDALPRTHMTNGFSVELGVLNEHDGELQIKSVVDIIRHVARS